MKKVNISVDIYKLKANPQELKALEEIGLASLFEQVTGGALTGRYPQGLPISKGKIWARIQNKLDQPQPNKGELHQFEFEESEYDLLKEVYLSEDTRFMPQQYRLVSQYIEAVEEAGREKRG